MAKVRPNHSVGTINGKLGKLVFVHCEDGRILVRQAPLRRAEFTPPELRNQSHFRSAIGYLRGLKANPAAYAVYKRSAQLRRKRACDLAISDFLRPPEITDVDLGNYSGGQGQTIRIQAVDQFEVRAVSIAITEMDGSLLEQGTAVLPEGESTWLYATQTAVPPGQTVLVHVTATDWAGNAASKTLYQALVATG